jgi:1,2-dihydroxy-3-keto-5-methylthiopentene dioxygenase
MARLQLDGKSFASAPEIRAELEKHGVLYERWGLHAGATGAEDDQILGIYQPEVDRLRRERGYKSVDLVALRPTTPNLAAICAKFDQEHHHLDDEVRFTVEGEGVFEIATADELGAASKRFLQFTAEPGDLIVVPAHRRHRFYLTETKSIRCIRLFQDPAGWEAIYPKAATSAPSGKKSSSLIDKVGP